MWDKARGQNLLHMRVLGKYGFQVVNVFKTFAGEGRNAFLHSECSLEQLYESLP